jgi:AdoMet-dependent heme synthase
MDILHRAQDVGMSVQVNTTVSKHNVDHPARNGAVHPGGQRGAVVGLLPGSHRAGPGEKMISAEQHERVFNWLYDLSQNAPFDIKGTAAPMYRRVAIERKRAEQGRKPVTFQGAGFQYADGLNRPTKGVNDGNGFLFISHIGEIQPRGFLPLTAGTSVTDDVVDVYRNTRSSSKICAIIPSSKALRHLRIPRRVRRPARPRLRRHRRLSGNRPGLFL